MNDDINKTKNPLHYLKLLMGLNAAEISDKFTPIFNARRKKREHSEFLESLEDDLYNIILSIDKKELSDKACLSFNASTLLCNLFNAELNSELEAHSNSLKLHGNLLENSIEIIENLLKQQKDSAKQDKSVEKDISALKEEVKKLSDERNSRSIKLSNNAKQSNPTPPDTIKYFYICVKIVLNLDTKKQLFKADVVSLARRLLLNRDELYKIEWGDRDPFKDGFFTDKINEYPELPEYLKTSKGKQPKLKPNIIKNIEIDLDL
jgi:hypothetical protein